MNRVFKEINIYLAQKWIFSKKKFEKLNRFDRNFWIFSNYLKIFTFDETYKSRENLIIEYTEIFSGFIWIYYLFEKFTVAAQWFFSGGTLGPLKDYQAPPVGGPGDEGPPPAGREVSFFKTIQSIWKWIHFSKMSTFSFPKRSIFSKKNFEELNIFYKNFWIFSKNYFKFSLFMICYKSREILCEF